MPHAVVTRNLGRERSFRKATVRSLTQALFKFERITTTLPRAKESQRLAERLITLGKSGDLSSRRRAVQILNDAGIVARLFSELAPRFSSRKGGYTRIVRAGFRTGDGATMAVLELTEMAAPKVKEKKPPKEKLQEKPVEGAPPMPKKEKEEKPVGFLQGLRKLFKVRPKK